MWKTSWRFQPGEGPSRGLFRDCTTSPINHLDSSTQDDTNIDLWWIKKVCVLHNLCEMFVDVRVYHFPVQTQISCKICISSFETSLALAGSCCGWTVQAGCWSVYLVLKNLQFRCYWSSRRGEVRVRVRGERSREVFKDDPTLNSWESHRPEKCRCVFVGPAPPCNSLRRYSETMEWGCSPLS